MVLQNYWAWHKYIQTTVTSAVTLQGVKDMSGNTVTQLYGGSNQWRSNSILNSLVALVFGTGTTAPTAEDYALETDATASFVASLTTLVNYDSAKNEFIFSATVTNTTADDIIISEIGVRKGIYSTTTDTPQNVLFAREVLQTPITVAAGETKTINYVWTMQ